MNMRAPARTETLRQLSFFSGNKGHYGMNLQAMCGPDLRFLAFSFRMPGATNDARAWALSAMQGSVESLPEPFYIVGDNAYPNTAKLLTPFPGRKLAPDQDNYNFYLSQLRIRIEMAFGLLVGRWGILWRPARLSLGNLGRTVHALIRLHNFCISAGDCNAPSYDADEAAAAALEGEQPRKTLRPRPAADTQSISYLEAFQTQRSKTPKAVEKSVRDAMVLRVKATGLTRPSARRR